MAIVVALLITALVVGVATELLWRQRFLVRGVQDQALRLQTQWLLREDLDRTRALLREDAERSPVLTTPDGVWHADGAVALPDGSVEGAAGAAGAAAGTGPVLASRIVDAQSRYNLTNLASAGVVDAAALQSFANLLRILGLDARLAGGAARAIADGQRPPGGAPGAGPRTVPLQRVDELLGVGGYTPKVLAVLQPFVVVLPQPTAVNVNTAPPEVMAAVTGLSLSDARALDARRRHAYFRTLAEFAAALPGGSTLPAGTAIGLRSDYFLLTSRIRVDGAALDATSLLFRRPDGSADLAWTHEQ